jgi:hypothetical protein
LQRRRYRLRPLDLSRRSSLSSLDGRLSNFWRFGARNYPEKHSDEGSPPLSARNQQISHYARKSV